MVGGGGGTRTSTLVLLFQSLTSIFATPPISNENSSAVNKDRSSRGITYKRATVLVMSLLNRITSYHVCNREERLFHKKSSTHNKEETWRLNMLSVLIGLAPYFEQTVLSLTCCSRFFFFFFRTVQHHPANTQSDDSGCLHKNGLILVVRSCQNHGWRKTNKTKEASDHQTVTKPQHEITKQRKNIIGSCTEVKPENDTSTTRSEVKFRA